MADCYVQAGLVLYLVIACDACMPLPLQVKEALARMEQEEREAAAAGDDAKRKYNSVSGSNSHTTPEEMEAWRIKRARADDPVAAQDAARSVGGYDLL